MAETMELKLRGTFEDDISAKLAQVAGNIEKIGRSMSRINAANPLKNFSTKLQEAQVQFAGLTNAQVKQARATRLTQAELRSLNKDLLNLNKTYVAGTKLSADQAALLRRAAMAQVSMGVAARGAAQAMNSSMRVWAAQGRTVVAGANAATNHLRAQAAAQRSLNAANRLAYQQSRGGFLNRLGNNLQGANQRSFGALNSNFYSSPMFLGTAAAGAGIGAMGSALRASTSIDSAETRARIFANIGRENLPEFRTWAIGIAQSTGSTIESIMDAYTEMAKAGINRENIPGLAPEALNRLREQMARMAVESALLFEITPQQSARVYGQLTTFYGDALRRNPEETIARMQRLAAAINLLGDRTAAKESFILEFLRIARGASDLINISDTQLAAVGSTMTSLMDNPGNAARAFMSGMNRFARMARQSGPGSIIRRTAWKTMAPHLPQVNGQAMTPQDFVDMITRNPMDALRMLSEVMGKIPDNQRAAWANDLFGGHYNMNWVQLLGRYNELATQNRLAQNTEKAAEEWQRNLIIRMESFQNKMNAFWQLARSTIAMVGDAILPEVGGLMEGGETFMRNLAGLDIKGVVGRFFSSFWRGLGFTNAENFMDVILQNTRGGEPQEQGGTGGEAWGRRLQNERLTNMADQWGSRIGGFIQGFWNGLVGVYTALLEIVSNTSVLKLIAAKLGIDVPQPSAQAVGQVMGAFLGALGIAGFAERGYNLFGGQYLNSIIGALPGGERFVAGIGASVMTGLTAFLAGRALTGGPGPPNRPMTTVPPVPQMTMTPQARAWYNKRLQDDLMGRDQMELDSMDAIRAEGERRRRAAPPDYDIMFRRQQSEAPPQPNVNLTNTITVSVHVAMQQSAADVAAAVGRAVEARLRGSLTNASPAVATT